jgi:hypothetical protein
VNITPQQRKLLWICVGVFVASYVFRSVMDSARQAAYYRQQAIRAAQQRAYAKAHPPAPARVSPTPVVPGTKIPPVATPRASRQPDTLSGTWRGSTAITGRGICTLTIELHEGAPGSFTGYSTLGCGNFAPLMAAQDRNAAAATLNRMSPAEAILSGAMESGAIHFKVDKTIGANSNGCAATSFTLTPFGDKRLAAEWIEGSCGHVMLQKVRS